MPLYPEAERLIRANLELIAGGRKPPILRIGTLSKQQLLSINSQRSEDELAPIVDVVLFDGRHMYRSRCVEDGYSISEVVQQIVNSFDDSSSVGVGRVTVLRSRDVRVDANGKMIRDEAVLECHGRLPHPELYSVVPRGDGKNHTKKKATR